MSNEGYKKLIVWQKSLLLVKEIYLVTDKLPKEELFGLTSQLRRAAISIPSNIAEGSRRTSTKEFRNFVRIAYGSASEIETQLEIIKILPYGKHIDLNKAEQQLEEILKMLNKLISSLSTDYQPKTTN